MPGIELEVQLQLVNEKVKFAGNSRSNPEVVIDYFPPYGDGEGYTSLELLLLSFSSCVGTGLLTLLRGKLQKTVTFLKATAKGTMREQHPKALTQIRLELTIKSPDTTDADVQAMLSAAEKICPVWAMLKGNVEISTTYTLINP